MRKKVTFVELTVLSGVAPLASAYMEAFCRKDQNLSAKFEFEKISVPVSSGFDGVWPLLEGSNAAVYAFSCYVWNSGLVRRLLERLLMTNPASYFMLGGPQVMHQAAKYLPPRSENVFICNGEGERTFASFLRVLISPEKDFKAVRGVSFYDGDQIATTEPEARIQDLSEIPSPFLENVLEKGKYSWIPLETNRGCPFKCNYCYWGGATGSKVFKYEEERVQRELKWISQSGCSYLFIADANWGMLKRDVELSRYLVECQKKHGSPIFVCFCGSKNTPDRVSEITQVFHEGGILSSQSVSMQTMNPETLRRVDRDNIKTAAYLQVQRSLNQQGISSFVELIWPLPGETLESFREGLATLCALGADSFLVYPLLLFNNVELMARKEEYGLVTVRDPDPNSEAEIVVQTNEVDPEALNEGLRYLYVVTCLQTLRCLRSLGQYLNQSGTLSYRDLFIAFQKFAWKRPEHPWTAFCDSSIRSLDMAKYSGTGALIHLVLHSGRETFDALLEDFVTTQEFWKDPLARFFFEVDLLNRPCIYRNTTIQPKAHRFTELQICDTLPGGYEVTIPEHLEVLLESIAMEGAERSNHFSITYRRSQLPFVSRKPLNDHYMYCHDTLQRMRDILPLWRAVQPAFCKPEAVANSTMH